MPRLRTVYRCQECGTASPKWVGRCPGCGEWSSLVEEVEEARPAPPSAGHRLSAAGEADRPVSIAAVDAGEWDHRPTGVAEVDRVLGGGLVPGSVTLLGGEPGIGKSTLLLQVLAAVAATGQRTLLVSGEESKQQVRLRAERLGALDPTLLLQSETVLPHVIAAIDDTDADLVVVDSIQTVFDPELGSAPGSVAQVRECAAQLVRLAKQRGTTIVLVGHVTKEGALAGPRVLEHVVDTVLSFEGDRHHALRLLRAVKHRFGSTSELGLFEMVDAGLQEVADPSALFLGDRHAGAPGSAVVPTMEGHRPLLVEVQGLVAPSSLAMPRRSVQGVDGNRVALLLAVLERRCHLSMAGADVYVSAVGGVRVVEPGADLAIALTLVSSLADYPLPHDVVACGEIGLAGEVRQVAHTERRLTEAARLGFTRAVVPTSAPDVHGLELIRVPSLDVALDAVGLAKALDSRGRQ
jgi:DNA repair protein RadA/Sms